MVSHFDGFCWRLARLLLLFKRPSQDGLLCLPGFIGNSTDYSTLDEV